METTPTPETDALAWRDESRIMVVETSFARKLERERDEARQAITDLTQRLQERQESFQAQLIRIEDGWREKLREANLNAKIWSEQSAEAIRQVSVSDALNRKLLNHIWALRALVEHVDNGCQKDVDGVNWFDARDVALTALD